MSLKTKKSFLCSFIIFFLVQCSECQRPVPEIRDRGNYKIRNVANGKFLTVQEQGIVGLRTGSVGTFPDRNSLAQGWTLIWKPLWARHQGYWIESRYEYLNSVTSVYPPNRTAAITNVWMLRYLGDQSWQIRNARSGLCLQLAENEVDVNEGECLKKDASFQHWNLIRVIVVPDEDEMLLRKD